MPPVGSRAAARREPSTGQQHERVVGAPGADEKQLFRQVFGGKGKSERYAARDNGGAYGEVAKDKIEGSRVTGHGRRACHLERSRGAKGAPSGARMRRFEAGGEAMVDEGAARRTEGARPRVLGHGTEGAAVWTGRPCCDVLWGRGTGGPGSNVSCIGLAPSPAVSACAVGPAEVWARVGPDVVRASSPVLFVAQ